MAWPNNTRLFQADLGNQARPTGGGSLYWTLPKIGLLAGLQVIVTGSVAGTLSAPNALGMASIISLIKLTINSGIDLINLTGAQYHYLLRQSLEALNDPVNQSNAYDAVTATTFDISLWLPIAINSRDPQGLIMLQNEQTQVSLQIDFLADASVATGATVTTTAVHPFADLFTVPLRDEDMPPLNWAQSITGEQRAVSGAGDVTYDWPRSNQYLQVIHGLGIGATGADSWSKAVLRVQQNQNLVPNMTPALADKLFSRYRGRTRELGVIPFDLFSSSGLGNYGSARDAIDTSQLTDIQSVITATGAGTLHTVKRQLVPIALPQ